MTNKEVIPEQTTENANNTVVSRNEEESIWELWSILHDLQVSVPAENMCHTSMDGIKVICTPVIEELHRSKGLIGHTECHIWYYDPRYGTFSWQAGHGSEKTDKIFRITDDELKCLVFGFAEPILSSDDVAKVKSIPEQIWSSNFNWIFPLNCRGEIFGILHVGFDEEISKPILPKKQLWFFYALANYLARAMDRRESSSDQYLIFDLIKEIPSLLHSGRMGTVYKQIMSRICDIIGSKSGVFRLYDSNLEQDHLTVCVKLGVGIIGKEALVYTVGTTGISSCPTPNPIAEIVQYCEACGACKRIMPTNTKSLRITFWEVQNPDRCIGQVCAYVEDNIDLDGRLKRRLNSISKSLSAAMETASHHDIRNKVQSVLEEQRKLAAKETDTRKLMINLVKEINKVMKSQSCELFLADPKEHNLYFEVSSNDVMNLKDYDVFYSIDDEKHLTSLIAKKKEPIAIPDPSSWHRTKGVTATIQSTEPGKTHSFIGVPVFRESNRVLGVIRCTNKKGYSECNDEIAAFHRHDKAVMTAIADSCSPLIAATQGERRIRERLITSGHEISATATVIRGRATAIINDNTNYENKIRTAADLRSICKVFSYFVNLHVKGIKDAASLIEIYQSDVNLSVVAGEKITWKPKEANIYGDVIAQVVDMVRTRAESKGIILDYDKLASAPEKMKIDKNRMKQIFYNLLINAVKYNRRRLITIYPVGNNEFIKFNKKTVFIRSRWSDDHKSFLIHVLSDGRQIYEDEVKHIWDYGFRGRAVKNIYSGLGIGMFLIKKISDNAPGLDINLDNRHEPVIFTVSFSHPILQSEIVNK